MATNFIDMMQPDLVAQQEALNRRQQLTDYLRQQSLQPIDPNQMTQTGAGAPNQAVPISPWQGLGKMAQGYFAGQSQTQNTADQTALSRQRMQGLAQLLQGGLPDSAPQTAPQAANGEPLQGIQTAPDGTPYADTGNQSSPLVAALGGVPKQQSTSSDSRFGLANLLRGSIADSFLPGAGKAMLDATAPTDFSKQLLQSGIDPNSTLGRQFMQQQLAKQNYIAPTRLGEGAYATQDGQVQGLPSAAPSGFINVRGPGGWQTQPVAGGLQAAAASKGAIEGASQDAKIEMIKDASGRMVPTRMGSVVNGQQNPQQQSNSTDFNQNAPATFNFPGMNPQQILGAINTFQDPVEKAAAITRLQGTAPQNINGGDAWQTMPTMQQPTGIGQSSYGEAIQKGQGEAAAKLSDKYGNIAEQANQSLSLNNQALDLVNKSDIGAGSSWIADTKNIIQKYVPGVSESSFQNTPSATLALEKELVNAATQKAKQQFGSRITQSEVNLMLNRGSPNVSMPKAAIQYLITSDNAVKNYQIQQANDLGKYLNNGGDPYRFEGWYANKFPMTNATNKIQMPAQNQLTPTQNTSTQVPSNPTVKTVNWGDLK